MSLSDSFCFAKSLVKETMQLLFSEVKAGWGLSDNEEADWATTLTHRFCNLCFSVASNAKKKTSTSGLGETTALGIRRQRGTQ